MGLAFKCPECWDYICTCGYEYEDWSIEDLEDQIKMFKYCPWCGKILKIILME